MMTSPASAFPSLSVSVLRVAVFVNVKAGLLTVTVFVDALLLVSLSAKTKSGLTMAVLLNVPVEEDVAPTPTVIVAPTGMVTPPLAVQESN